MYKIVGNIFNKAGKIDLGGNEEAIHEGEETYMDWQAADSACAMLERTYPNAYVDIVERD